MKNRGIWITVFLLPTFAIFMLIYAIPTATVVSTSFFSWRGFSGEMQFVGLANYIEAFSGDSSFHEALTNTLVWILLQSTVHVTLGTVVALMLAKKPFIWKLVRTSYMIPNIISASALAMIFLNVFNPNFGIVNSIIRALGYKDFSINWYYDFSTAFPTVTVSWLVYAGLVTILVLAEIMSIPESVLEAARIDGATDLQVDTLVILPMLRNIIGTCVIVSATSMLKEFELIFLTTKGGPADLTLNLPLYLYKTALIENNFGYANMIGTVLIIMGIVSIILISRMFKLGSSDV
ncbi:MAG TPA: sugar ABC transporter permease [Clostridia bacterium]|nr:sugar ABC transporter permease [Clostridia bacterium]